MRQYGRAALRIVQGVIEVVVHWLFGFVYGGPGQSMPPIRDLILLDSATNIALKIRTGKVSSLELLFSVAIFFVIFLNTNYSSKIMDFLLMVTWRFQKLYYLIDNEMLHLKSE